MLAILASVRRTCDLTAACTLDLCLALSWSPPGSPPLSCGRVRFATAVLVLVLLVADVGTPVAAPPREAELEGTGEHRGSLGPSNC